MVDNVEIIKANKEKSIGEHRLVTDGQAKVVFTEEDGQVDEFVVSAVNPLFWGHIFDKPVFGFGGRMDSARIMGWHIFVTDIRIVFWSPSIESLLGTVKKATGKSTVGQFYYSDFSSIYYGFSEFETHRIMFNILNEDVENSDAKDECLATLSFVSNSDLSSYDQTALTIESDRDTLKSLFMSISNRAKKLKFNCDWDKFVATVDGFDFENDSGKFIIDAQLYIHSPIEEWFSKNLPISLQDDTPGNSETFESPGTSKTFEATETPETSETVRRFCTNCGTQLNEGVKFCKECGSPCDV